MKNTLSINVLFILVFGLLTSPYLFAHNSLTESVPADKATLHQNPEFIELRFSDSTYLNSVILINSDGEETPIDLTDSGGFSSYFKLPLAEIEPGNYEVTWQVEGLDTHKIDGSFTFNVMMMR